MAGRIQDAASREEDLHKLRGSERVGYLMLAFGKYKRYGRPLLIEQNLLAILELNL